MVQQILNHVDPETEFEKISQMKLHQIKVSKKLFQPYSRVEPQSPSIPDFDPLIELERAIATDIFKPMAFLLNYMFPFPDRIVYNGTTRRFDFIRASMSRRVVCALWILAIMWRLSVKILPASQGPDTVLSKIVKISYVFFLFYCGVFFLQLWTKGRTFTSIFNQGIDVASSLFLKFQCASRTRLVFLVTHISWIFCLTFSFTSHVMGGIIAIINEVTGNQNNSMLLFGYENKTDPHSLNELDPQYTTIVHAILVLANFLNTFNWMLSFQYIGTWALLYRQLFSIFFIKMEAMNKFGYELDLPNEIRTFNKIAALVDKYNAFNGLFLLCGAVVAILYISTSIEQLVTGVMSISQFGLKIHLFLSYLPILNAALMMSELHKKASMFSDVIKEYYQQWKGVSCYRSSEALYGIAIVHHDIGMLNIGFKSFGFFTVTYQFVVTMLSVIITYALVAIQWLPQLNSAALKDQSN